MPRPRQPTSIEELLDRVVVTPDGCWMWIGGDSGTDRKERGSNYPRILRPGTRNAMAGHRYVYETFKGPIPPGYVIDHICARWSEDPWLNRRCVNPDHLEAVTQHINQVRKFTGMRNGSAITAPAMPLPPIDDALLAPGEQLEDFQL